MIGKFRRALCKSTVFSLIIILCISPAVLALDTNSGFVPVKRQVNSKDSSKMQNTCEIIIGDILFKVKKVCESTDNGFKKASKGKKLAGIYMAVENKGIETRQMTSVMMFKLVDSQKKKYSIALPEGLDSLNGILAPKAAMNGNIWFEVPKEETKFQLVIRPSMLEQQTGTLDINTAEGTAGAHKTKAVKAESSEPGYDENEIIKSTSKEASIDNLVFKLGEISTGGDDTSENGDTGNRLLNIELSVKNNGTEEEQITSVMTFELIDSEGDTYDIVLPERQGLNGILKPKDKLCGNISFMIRGDRNDYKLKITPWATKSTKAFIAIHIG